MSKNTGAWNKSNHKVKSVELAELLAELKRIRDANLTPRLALYTTSYGRFG